MKELPVLMGKQYSRGKRKRFVVSFKSYFVLYVTPSSKGKVTGVPIWDFKKWAERECLCTTKECTCLPKAPEPTECAQAVKGTKP